MATVALVAGCSSNSGPSSVSPADLSEGALNGQGEVDINFWHEMSGTNGTVLQKLIDQFNTQNKGKIKVNLVFKGNYDQGLAAYKSATPQQRPDVLQMNDVGTRYMIDSNTIVPAQTFIDVDHYDVSDLQPHIASYYTVDGKLDSMPFNTSMPLLYINKEAFEKAGLDPTKPPTTLDEIEADARKIQSTPGETVKFGFGTAVYSWFLEQWDATANQQFCDANNGRTGRANTVNLANPTNINLLTWLRQMEQEGLADKLPSDTDQADSAFTSGTVAMLPESTANVSDFQKTAAQAANPFTVVTGFYPKVSPTDNGGPIIGGGSLWAINSGNSAKERASWDLEQFLASPSSQVTWHTGTGYFPITKTALNDPMDQQWVQQHPAFGTAITQLAQTPATYGTQGCSLGVMGQVRQIDQNAMEAAVLQGEDPQKALSDATNTANSAIASYNASLK